MNWDKYRQFWLQAAQWSLRRLDAADFNTEVAVEKGEGHVSVEAKMCIRDSPDVHRQRGGLA